MSKDYISKLSNAFSTGGGGVNFEQSIQALFLLSLLVDGFCPAMNEKTKRVCFQTKHLGFDVDDLAVFTYRGLTEGKMLCQIKHSITATASDKAFREFIYAAWSDFNKKEFDREFDKIALITAQISIEAQKSLRFLHAQAIAAIDEKDFIERINMPSFSNDSNRKMLSTIKSYIADINNNDPSAMELWNFCKAFILLLFDMDCEESVNRTLSSSLIKCNSSMDALLVWTRLVQYAANCNQTASSIERDNIDAEIQSLFRKKYDIRSLPAPIAEIDLFIPAIALIGAWREDNQYDCEIIEKISGIPYSEFEAKARTMVSKNPEYLQVVNSSWKVLHNTELLDQCKAMLFDNTIEQMICAAKIVLNQDSKRIMNHNERYYVSSGGEYDNSLELRTSLLKNLCWVKGRLLALPNCNQNKTEGALFKLVDSVLQNATWKKWASLGDCLQNLAELAPDAFLERVELEILHNGSEILKLFPQSSIGLFGSTNYISELLWSLEILAWSPEYVVRAVGILGMLEALPYEKTNWTNTPLNSIVSILLPWYPQTTADYEKRKNALICLKNDNQHVFWNALKKLLPNQTATTSVNPKPKYMQLSIPEEVTVNNAEVNECYAYLLELAVENTCNEVGKIADLIDQIGYMNKNTLTKYLDSIDSNIDFFTEDNSFELWIKLRERLALIMPTDGMVIHEQQNRIQVLIERLEPQDIRMKYRELYLGNRYWFCKGDYAAAWDSLETEKSNAIKEIFDQFGIKETEMFGISVNNTYDVAAKLGSSLTQDELSMVIEACSAGVISQEFTSSCISSFMYMKGAEKLLGTSLCHKDDKFIVEIISRIPFSTILFEVISQVLEDDTVYWEKARMPFVCHEDELTIIVGKLVSCKRYVTAINIIGRSKFEQLIDAEYICNLLLLAGTEETIDKETFDKFAIQKIIGWLQHQESIDLDIRSNIEFIYLPLLDSNSEVQPHSLYMRLNRDPEFFCSMIELFYKKKEDEKHKIELNKRLSDRLFLILFRCRVTPGINWDGTFDEKLFKSWMAYVEKWSKENDRYEVTMHTIGSGLSYVKLDEENLPPLAVIEELNRIDNGEIRRGYYLGVVNQRGVHWVDPEGIQELEIAEDFKKRSDIAEAMGYSRYASVLRKIADHYNQEAMYNRAENKDKT